jgi:hypothetical protein
VSKELLTIEELTNRVLAKIRECRGAKDVSEISIYEVESSRSDQNWGVTIVGAGRDGTSAASRAAISVLHELGPRYDLLTDRP